jgi:predicted PurR-regulated permease PerM
MWPGSSPSALINGAAGLTIVALVITALHFADDFLIPLALAGILSFTCHGMTYWKVPSLKFAMTMLTEMHFCEI